MKHPVLWLCTWVFDMDARTKWDIKYTKKNKSDGGLVKNSPTPISKLLLLRNNSLDENQKNKNH